MHAHTQASHMASNKRASLFQTEDRSHGRWNLNHCFKIHSGFASSSFVKVQTWRFEYELGWTEAACLSSLCTHKSKPNFSLETDENELCSCTQQQHPTTNKEALYHNNKDEDKGYFCRIFGPVRASYLLNWLKQLSLLICHILILIIIIRQTQ